MLWYIHFLLPPRASWPSAIIFRLVRSAARNTELVQQGDYAESGCHPVGRCCPHVAECPVLGKCHRVGQIDWSALGNREPFLCSSFSHAASGVPSASPWVVEQNITGVA